MGTIIAIGGGNNGRKLNDGTTEFYNTELIDREVVKATNKENPNFLFICHAIDCLELQEEYFETMKRIYGGRFKCNCRILRTSELLNNEITEEKLKWADIIYEGGGDTLSMIDLWKKSKFDKKLFNAYNDGKVICGISAGAVCWFNSCNSSYFNKFITVECLNWIDLYMTPHCNESGRLEYTKKALRDNNLLGIALSNQCALHIIGDMYRVLVSGNDAYCLKSYWDNGKYIEQRIEPSMEFKDINELFNRSVV